MAASLPKIGDFADRANGRGDARGTLRDRGRRFAQLLGIARRHGLIPFRRLDFTSDPAPEAVALRRRQAEGLRRGLEEAGGAFVKMGQLLSTRDDLLPDEWLEQLSHLQKNVAPAPWPSIETLLRAELGAPVDEVFAEFDPVPIAAASIAQVHRARLRGPAGATVAVKIQRPGIVPVVTRDVDIALRVTRFLARTSQQAKQLGLVDIAEQYAADLVRQVDFRLEAVNLAALRATHGRSPRADELRLPALYQEFSTPRVLVMEFLEGRTLAQVKTDGDRGDALVESMRTVLRSFLRQIVFDGVYHSDLHPGNIMLTDDGRPALVDFGSVGRLDSALRGTVQELVVAFLQADTRGIADAALTIAPLRDPLDEAPFRRDLASFVTYELGPGAVIDVHTVDRAVEVFAGYGIALPPDFVAAGRAFAILDGTLRSLVPTFDLLEESRALAGQQIRDQMTPQNVQQLLTREVLGVLPGFRRLPRRLDRIGAALEQGTLNVNVRLLADRRDRRLLIALVRQIMLVAVGAGAAVVGLVFLAAPAVRGAVLGRGAVGTVLLVAGAVLLVGAAIDVVLTRRRN